MYIYMYVFILVLSISIYMYTISSHLCPPFHGRIYVRVYALVGMYVYMCKHVYIFTFTLILMFMLVYAGLLMWFGTADVVGRRPSLVLTTYVWLLPTVFCGSARWLT